MFSFLYLAYVGTEDEVEEFPPEEEEVDNAEPASAADPDDVDSRGSSSS